MDIQQAYLNACLAELEALKPGNVHVFSDGHGMQVQDFIDSAEVSAPALCDDVALGVRSLGLRMLHALQASYEKVHCNTNLGIILLAGPIVQAALTYPDISVRTALEHVLNATTMNDAEAVYAGIRLVQPAGIGQRTEHDVHDPAQITLFEAMQIASSHDNVAAQYVSHYAEVFDHVLPLYAEYCQRWERPAWALTAVYLYWLSRVPDSHIQRKFGLAQASVIQQAAQTHFTAFIHQDNPKMYMSALLAWDAELKQTGINPGTSADLTVTTALLANLAS